MAGLVAYGRNGERMKTISLTNLELMEYMSRKY